MGNWRLREVRVTWRLSFLHCVTNYNKLGGLKQHRCDLRVCGSGHSSAGSCAQALPRCWLSGGLIWSWGSTSKLLRWLAESRGLPPECESLEATLSMWYKTRLFASLRPLGDSLSLWEGLSPSFWRRQWQPTPVLLPGKSHGRRSLVGCRPWGR